MSNDQPWLDLCIGVLWLLISLWHWIGYQQSTEPENVEERALGASVIMGQLGAVITGSSIILAGIGAFVALSQNPINAAGKNHIYFAALWAVIALGLAILTMGILPRHAPTTNFVRLRGIAVCCSMTLYFCMAAGARFVLAVGALLFPA